MILESTQKILNLHAREKNKHLRLGQFFCNEFVEGIWPELYDEENNETATAVIEKWLSDRYYWATIPDKKR